MSRRSRPDAPFSLFAFQDIIAAVTGVMILLTLLLVLDLVTRVVAPPTNAPPAPGRPTPATTEDTQTRDDLRTRLQNRLAAEPDRVQTPAEQAARLRADAERDATDEAQRDEAAAARLQRDALAAQATADAARLNALARELADTRDRLSAELLRTRVTLLDGEASDRRQWFLLCDAAGVTAARLQGGDDLQPVAAFPDARQALPWAAAKSPANDAFVLLVPTGGVDTFNTLQRGLLDSGFDVGWDLASPALAADLARVSTRLFQGATP